MVKKRNTENRKRRTVALCVWSNISRIGNIDTLLILPEGCVLSVTVLGFYL